MKETEEAHLRRPEEGREIHSRDPLNQQRDGNVCVRRGGWTKRKNRKKEKQGMATQEA